MKPLIEQLRDAQQAGVEIIEPWDHNPYLYGQAADAIERIIKAWDSLKPGSYDKDIWETWLIQKMKPAIDAARGAPDLDLLVGFERDDNQQLTGEK
jgi:hypothetical protein